MLALQASLVALCEAHWPKMRGPEPTTRLTKALWEIPPHLADLFVHLYGVADPCLGKALDRLTPPQALALLVLTELEGGDAEGVRNAYAASNAPIRVARGAHSPCVRQPDHIRRTDVRGLAQTRPSPRPVAGGSGLGRQTGRWDTKAMLGGLKQVAQVQASPIGVAAGSRRV